MSRIRIYLTNLGKYNEGVLMGEWLDLPATDEELAACKDRIGINEYYEEWFITDYETELDGYRISEYEDIDELNEIAALLENLTDEEIEIINALTYHGYTVEKSVKKIDDCIIWSGCHDMEDVAMEYAEETGLLDSIPDNLRFYFDYAALGRDMEIEGNFYFTDSGNCIEIVA